MPAPWMASLHGGHCGDYCDHAEGTLRGVLDAALGAGMRLYGLTEHAPRVRPEHVFDEERMLGWDLEVLARKFGEYAAESAALQTEYAGRLEVLRGFEIEVVPEDAYAEIMQGFRAQHAFDYIVGSVHWVDGHIIDYTTDRFDAAVRHCGGLEGLAVRYYRIVSEMVERMRPEVTAHFDLVRRHAPDGDSVATPAARRAACEALDAVAAAGSILDINTGGLRKGLGHPYPAPWLLREAAARGIGVCFGDDSHRPSEIGAGIPEAREYLLAHGIRHIAVLRRSEAGLVRRDIPLG